MSLFEIHFDNMRIEQVIVVPNGEKIWSSQFCDLSSVSKRSSHNHCVVAKLFVIVEDFCNAFHTF